MANAFKRKLERNIGTTLTQIDSYAVASSTETTLIGLTISNTTAEAVNVDVTLNNGTNDTYLVKTAPIPSGGSLIAVGGDQKVVLEPNDMIKVKSSAASSVDVIMSLLEIS